MAILYFSNSCTLQLSNDDYKGKDAEAALADFRERVRQYEAVYEPVTESEFENQAIGAAHKLCPPHRTQISRNHSQPLTDHLLSPE